MRPKSCIPDSPGDPWYIDVPLGHNTLGKFLKDILKEGSMTAENKSNHSLRLTAISRMYENKVTEKLIMERSGHLSVHGLVSYERTTLAQKETVCDTLLGMPMQEFGNTTVKSKKRYSWNQLMTKRHQVMKILLQ